MAELGERHGATSPGGDYCLAHSEGFRVETAGGRLAVAQEVLFGPDGGVDELIVVGGLLGNRRWIVPAKDVGVVKPRLGRISLVDRPLDVRSLGRARLPELLADERTALC